MQGAVCLAKFEYYPDVHDKKTVWFRCTFWVIVPVSGIPETCLLIGIALCCSKLLNLKNTCSQILLCNVMFVFWRIFEVSSLFYLPFQEHFKR